MPKLSGDALTSALAQLHGWVAQDDAVVKTFRFSTFPDGIAFVNRVADLAEDLGHHPDIDIRYSMVTMHLSTHSEGGVTEKDIALAKRIDALLAR